MTLVEVVAALALLGTLLGGVVVAKNRLLHQWSHARLKHDAVALLDQQLAAWWDSEEGVPRLGTGPLGDRLAWRCQTREAEAASPVQWEVVRIQAFNPERLADGPLAHLELIFAATGEEEEPQDDGLNDRVDREAG